MKILIIRFSSIGDIVLTTPVIRVLKTQVDNAEIHYATKARFAGLLKENPYVDKLHLLDDKLGLLITDLKREKFDHIIDLHNNLRTRIIKFSLGVKSSSFNKLNWEKWLMVNLKINKLPSLHIVDRYLQAA
ncbi:MAG: glycosyl transferase, partial [Cyclobacteriaceae bacterium]